MFERNRDRNRQSSIGPTMNEDGFGGVFARPGGFLFRRGEQDGIQTRASGPMFGTYREPGAPQMGGGVFRMRRMPNSTGGLLGGVTFRRPLGWFGFSSWSR